MTITRYSFRNRLQELDQLANRFGRVFSGDVQSPANGSDWLPAVNVVESSEELVLTAEVPGMTRDDIDIELKNNVITISGETMHDVNQGDDERRYHVWERRFGSFQRSFTLPRTVLPEDIVAEYIDGILTVRVPKVPEAKSRRIEIGTN